MDDRSHQGGNDLRSDSADCIVRRRSIRRALLALVDLVALPIDVAKLGHA
jgi:hypothetical protein